MPTAELNGLDDSIRWTLDIETPGGERPGHFEVPVYGDEKEEDAHDTQASRPADWNLGDADA